MNTISYKSSYFCPKLSHTYVLYTIISIFKTINEQDINNTFVQCRRTRIGSGVNTPELLKRGGPPLPLAGSGECLDVTFKHGLPQWLNIGWTPLRV